MRLPKPKIHVVAAGSAGSAAGAVASGWVTSDGVGASATDIFLREYDARVLFAVWRPERESELTVARHNVLGVALDGFIIDLGGH
jgi:hypothetical protein